MSKRLTLNEAAQLVWPAPVSYMSMYMQAVYKNAFPSLAREAGTLTISSDDLRAFNATRREQSRYGKKQPNGWSKREINLLKRRYGKIRVKQLYKELNEISDTERTLNAIYLQASRLNLKKAK